ncbi:MAG: hypothetical protein K9M45_12315 [Kiritimatiellales bacterium]|nr:hypothetical protein [Kiritimatiellales bacterium]
MKRFNIVVPGCLLVCLIGFCGCGKQVEDKQLHAVADELPADLQLMQGSWSSANSNTCSFCNVNITGYAMRLTYRKTADDPMFKKNGSFESIDEQRKVLVEHDGVGGLSYNIRNGDDGILLELKFYNSANQTWEQVSLKRES